MQITLEILKNYLRQLKYYIQAGSLYESVGNNEKALKAYENALTLDPGNPEALQAKARLSD